MCNIHLVWIIFRCMHNQFYKFISRSRKNFNSPKLLIKKNGWKLKNIKIMKVLSHITYLSKTMNRKKKKIRVVFSTKFFYLQNLHILSPKRCKEIRIRVNNSFSCREHTYLYIHANFVTQIKPYYCPTSNLKQHNIWWYSTLYPNCAKYAKQIIHWPWANDTNQKNSYKIDKT